MKPQQLPALLRQLLFTVCLLAVCFSAYGQTTTISSFTPASGPVGTLLTVHGTNFAGISSATLGGVPAIIVNHTDTTAQLLVMPGTTAGKVAVVSPNCSGVSSDSFSVVAGVPPSAQQGDKLVGTDSITNFEGQGFSVAISADGNTAIVGGYSDEFGKGAAWVYTRTGSLWQQQGPKLVGMGAEGFASQGLSVAINADGTTAIVGGPNDNDFVGAAWVFTRIGSTWVQQGNKLVGSDGLGSGFQGWRVSLSADGNTAILGGFSDNNDVGAAWIYTRTAGVWSQQGPKLVGTGAEGKAQQGHSVALSADGNTAIVGGVADNGGAGAAWVFTRSGFNWLQQGSKLVGSGAVNADTTGIDTAGTDTIGTGPVDFDLSDDVQQGFSVALSADGNTAIVGGVGDNAGVGAAWVYARTCSTWAQQGSKLVGSTNALGSIWQGFSVALSADGNTAIVGGRYDSDNAGAAWVYTRTSGEWAQHGPKLVGSGASGVAQQGNSVALSADGSTAIIGGPYDNAFIGAAWVFSGVTTPTTIASISPANGPIGTLLTVTGSNLSGLTSASIGGTSAIIINKSDTQAQLLVMPGTPGGTVVITDASSTITSTDSFTVVASVPPTSQQGEKLVGTGTTGDFGQQGASVALSADGNTAIVGGYYDDGGVGAAWVYTRNGGTWLQQGSKLVGSGAEGASNQGFSVDISADGNTAIVGGFGDNNLAGAAWVFTRSGNNWSQQGEKLVGTGAVGGYEQQGFSVSISADGNTALVGAHRDDGYMGATWVYTRSGGVWTQQGDKLVGTGGEGTTSQGRSLALSADGNVAVVGGYGDNHFKGAAWVFTRSGNNWYQQGDKLVGTGGVGLYETQGFSVDINADGNAIIVGGPGDNDYEGASWVFARCNGFWVQQGDKLVATDATIGAQQGASVALSADGNMAIVGGISDFPQGAAWVFTRTDSTWSQQGSKRVGSGAVPGNVQQGISIALSSDGNTAIVGGYLDNISTGAAWVFSGVTTPPTITSISPASGPIGTLLTVTGSNLSGLTSASIGGTSAIVVNKSDTQVQLLVMPGTPGGTVVVTDASSTITSTDSFTVVASVPPAAQQGEKLVGTGTTGQYEQQGSSVALSADGNTAIVGGFYDDSGVGAVWVYTRIGGTWLQQGSKLVGSGAEGDSYQGFSVDISADGNTAIVGGWADNNFTGAAWIFTRSGKNWYQQGEKLVGTGAVGGYECQGYSVSISADGNTALVGAYRDDSFMGATWVYTRSGGVWAQQGDKLVGSGAEGTPAQGTSLALSADGKVAVVGGYGDNDFVGAAWVFARTDSGWAQQGSKLVGMDAEGNANQGGRVAINADGSTIILGGHADNSTNGASWVFTRSNGFWIQQGSKLVATDATSGAQQGSSVALSADGNTAIIGGTSDNHPLGAAWVFTRTDSTWSQQGSKRVGTGAAQGNVQQGISIDISLDGNTAIVGGYSDNISDGAAWVFSGALNPPTITDFTQTTGSNGTVFNIKGTNFIGATAVRIGGTSAQSFTVNSETSITATVGTAIMGAVASSGVLTIEVITPGGIATSTNTVTAEEPFDQFFDSYKLGPNPTAGEVQVLIASKQRFAIRFELLDLSGRVVFSGNYQIQVGQNQPCVMNLGSLNGGVYYLRAINQTSGQILRTDRVLKQ